METHPQQRTLAILTWSIAPLLAAVSLCGLIIPGTYARETPFFAIQGFGQDAFDLFFVLPALLLSLAGLARGWRPAWHIWAGLIIYLIYTFAIYAFSLYFNYLFLGYCAVLGLGAYAALVFYSGLRPERLAATYGGNTPIRTLGIILLVIAFLFGMLWLKEIVPALLGNVLPASVVEQGLRTNAVHVLDLSLLLPGMVIAGIALLRRRPLGYVFGPTLAAFAAVMALSIAVMVSLMKVKGLPAEWGLVGVLGALALVSAGVFAVFERTRPNAGNRAGQ